MTGNPPNLDQTVIVILPSILAFLTAALVVVLAYLTHRGSSVIADKVEQVSRQAAKLLLSQAEIAAALVKDDAAKAAIIVAEAQTSSDVRHNARQDADDDRPIFPPKTGDCEVLVPATWPRD